MLALTLTRLMKNETIPGVLLPTTPNANTTAQKFPKAPSGLKASTIDAPVLLPKAAFQVGFKLKPLPSPIPKNSTNNFPRMSPEAVIARTACRDALGGKYT
jgi:hypothetical protein